MLAWLQRRTTLAHTGMARSLPFQPPPPGPMPPSFQVARAGGPGGCQPQLCLGEQPGRASSLEALCGRHCYPLPWLLHGPMLSPPQPPVCSPLSQDAFSFGVCMWEMLTFRAPWSNITSPWQVGQALRRSGDKLVGWLCSMRAFALA